MMTDTIDVSLWTISNNGYEWVDGFLHEKQGVAGATIKTLSDHWETGSEEPYKHFVRLDGTPNSFIDFANQHGPLMRLFPSMPEEHKQDQSLSFWQEQYKAMQLTHNVYQATKENDARETLMRLLSIQEITQNTGDISNINLKSHTDLIDATRRVMANNSVLTINHIVPISTHDLVGSPNISLTVIGKIFLSRLLEPKTSLYDMRYSVKYNAIKDAWQPAIQPSSLLAYMWYQLGEEVSGHRKYKQCRHCNKWEDVTQRRKDWLEHPDCGAKARVKKSRLPKEGI